MTDAPYRVRDNREQNRFEIDLGDGQFAFATYRRTEDRIRFDHTEVPENHGGKGLGTALVRAGLAAARDEGLKVIPICPFFRAYLRKHPEDQQLLPSDQRHLLDA